MNIPQGNFRINVPVQNEKEENSCLLSYFQDSNPLQMTLEQQKRYVPGQDDLKLKYLKNYAVQFLREPTNNQLRTEEQIGYIINTNSRSDADIGAVYFTILSPTFTVSQMIQSLDRHLLNMRRQVREMTDLIREAQGEALRSTWLEAMPWFFFVHRSFSALVLIANLWLARLLINSLGWQHVLTRLTFAMILVIFLAVLSEP